MGCAMVKQELRNEKNHNLERRLENVEDCVPFLSNIVFSHVPSSYESPQEIFQKIFTFVHKVMLTLTYSWPSGSIISHSPY
jgi:hypothetical protein